MKSSIGYVALTCRTQIGGRAVDVGECVLSYLLFRYASQQALWAVGIALALLAIAAVAPYLPSTEWGVVAAGTTLLVYMAHFAKGVPWGLRWIALAIRLRLPPRPLLRAVAYRLAMELMDELHRNLEGNWALRRLLEGASWFWQGSCEEAAWAIASTFERRFWSTLGKTALFGLGPILGVLVTFRSVITHGNLLDKTAHLSFFEAAAYPIAALIDVALGSELRALLRH